MGSVAETLEPPFYAAILNDNQPGLEDSLHMAPTDEMVSLAPAQPGFLGLETTRDPDGRWVAISYWRDLDAIEGWRAKGGDEIAKRFDGIGFKDACGLRVSLVEERLSDAAEELRAEQPAIPNSSLWSLGAVLLTAFPAIAGLLGHEQIG